MKTLSTKTQIKAILFHHRGMDQIELRFAYDDAIRDHIKQLEGVKWSKTHGCFYLPHTPDDLKRLLNHCRGKVWVDISELQDKLSPLPTKEGFKTQVNVKKTTAFDKLSHEIQNSLREFRKWMEQHRYSDQTVRNYINHLSQFFLFLGDADIQKVVAEDVVRFNHCVIIKDKLSISYQRVITGAIKLFYSHSFNHSMDIDQLDRPFREKTLPIVLSKSEVERIIQSAGNIKNKAMLSTIYSCGLRRGELLALKIVDLDKERNMIRIEQAKGRKDRYVPYSEKLRGILREYYAKWKPKIYLFEGQGGSPREILT